jgi:Cu(I)/Ag(I) efflux system membrane fusion protein/cobalt-zinc-cadmium efflux system membrane fusion protein
LSIGSKVEVTAAAWPGQRFEGRIEQVYPYITEPSRTVKVRVSLANRDGRLKPGMLVAIGVASKQAEGLLIPADAIVDSGARQVVFVAQGQGYFEPRDVQTGARSNGQAIVLAGLNEGDEVAGRAAFFLDSETKLQSAVEDYEAASSQRSIPAQPRFELRLQITPNPPRVGKNMIDVQVQDRNAQPVTDAEVQVVFTMPAMPSMNMPAMRAQSAAGHVGNGVYRGAAALSMAGSWDVTVSAVRAGQTLAEQRTSLRVR